MTREEERKARARSIQARHLAMVKKQKEWLAAHPHVAEQQAREKEERRKNNETIRMLQAMKEEPTKTKKSVNKFSALMEDDSSEEECQIENVFEPVKEIPTEPKKKFVWADECDE